MKISCIAVDDEPFALEKIKGYIERVESFKLLATFKNAIDALSFLNKQAVDVIFLDVQMEELTGIQMIESMDVKPIVILTTAYDKYSIKGYDLNVTDYLLKPYSFQRFLQSVNKAYDAMAVRAAKKPSAIINDHPHQGNGYNIRSRRLISTKFMAGSRPRQPAIWTAMAMASPASHSTERAARAFLPGRPAAFFYA